MNHALPSGSSTDESGFGGCQENATIVQTKFWWRRNNGLGLFFMVRAKPLVPVKGNLNDTSYNDILDNSVLPILWQQFGEGPFLFQHDNAVYKNLTGLHRALTSTPTNTFEINWKADCKPGLIAQHQCPTSLMLLWLNGSKSLQQWSSGKPSQNSESCYSSKWGTDSILMPMILEWNVWQGGVHILLVM
jgi:hypothetical protein